MGSVLQSTALMLAPCRRKFLKAAGAAVAGTALGIGARQMARASKASAPGNRERIFTSCKWGMIDGASGVRERFQWCKEAGYDGMELISPLSPLGAEVAQVREASRETDMPIHGLVNIRGNRQFRLSSPDEVTRDEGRRLLEQSLQDCSAYGGDSVLLVPGKVRGPNEAHDDVWNRSIPQIRKVLPLAAKLCVRVLIENVWNGFCETPELLRDYIDAMESPWVGVYFDIGNVRKFGPSEDWIRILGRRIVKLDVKDWSKAKGFCKIGDGDVNWSAVCDALAKIDFSGWATAEVAGGKRERLADIARRMDRVLQRG